MLQEASAPNEVYKPLGALLDGGTGMVGLPGCVPKDIELEVGCLAFMAALEMVKSRLHRHLCSSQCLLRITGITSRPELRPDLEAGDFSNRTYSTIIVTALNH